MLLMTVYLSHMSTGVSESTVGQIFRSKTPTPDKVRWLDHRVAEATHVDLIAIGGLFRVLGWT